MMDTRGYGRSASSDEDEKKQAVSRSGRDEKPYMAYNLPVGNIKLLWGSFSPIIAQPLTLRGVVYNRYAS